MKITTILLILVPLLVTQALAQTFYPRNGSSAREKWISL